MERWLSSNRVQRRIIGDAPKARGCSRIAHGARHERFIGVIYRPDTGRWNHQRRAILARQFDGWVRSDETTGGDASSGRIAAWRSPARGGDLSIRAVESDATDDEIAIRELVDTWMDASRRGDLDTVLKLMTDDMIFMVPGRQPFGRDEFRAMSEGMSGVAMDGRSDIQEIRMHGDWAWIRCRVELMVTPPNGEPKHRSGYTLSILQRGPDGRWRLTRDANLVS